MLKYNTDLKFQEKFKSYLSLSIYYESYGWFVSDTQFSINSNKRIYNRQKNGAAYIR